MSDHMKALEARRSELIAAAAGAWENAYAPYSHFQVGAAVLTASGEIYAGCNVENASFGGTVCAERNAIGAAVVAGAKEIVAITVYTDTDVPTPPCGICRQVIAEFGEVNVLSVTREGAEVIWTLDEILPHRFEGHALKR